MADVWSPWVKNEYNFRCMLRYSTSTEADRVSVSLEGWSQSAQTTINYGKSVLEWNENGGAFTNLANVYPSALSYGATAHNSSASDWWTRVYGRDRYIYLQHWFSSPGSSVSEYVTGARAGTTITVPARAYERPHAPSSPSLVRNSDSSVTLAWGPNYTSSSEAYPWTGVNVYRRVDGGSWAKLGSVSWDKTGYTDSSTSANHLYEYKVRSYNGTGESTDASCGSVRMTPSAPASVTAVRVSDTSQKVSWERGENASNTWESAYVQRQVDGGAWASLATLPGSSANYTDSSTEADHAYAYRVASGNASATSGWTESGTVCTTPAAPKSVTASATGAATVSVSATGLSAIASAFDVEHRAGASGEWGETKHVTALPVAMASAAGENFYRVRATVDGLASAWTVSAGVTTVAQPKAPTLTGVSARYATGSEATVSWVPNHPDGSEQNQVQVEWTLPSGEKRTRSVTGSSTSCESGTLPKGHLSVRVRTMGAWAEGDGWGEWCEPVEFDVYDLATVSFTSPVAGSTVDRVPVTVSWEASDETGVASQTVEVVGPDGAVVWSQTLRADARSLELGQHTAMPQNRSSYAVRLTVWGGSGLSVTAELAFSTLWSAPDLPSASVTYDRAMAAHVTVSFGVADGLPATTSVDCVRVLADGSTLALATGMADGESVIDRLPPLNAVCRYRLTAHSESGATSVRDVSAMARCADAVLNFGQDAAAYVRCAYNPSLSHSYSRSVEYLHFADGGESGGLPVAYGLDERDFSTSLSWDTRDFSAADELARTAYDCWLRLPTGQRTRDGVSWSVDRSAPGLWSVSAKLTETVWEEPTDA